MSNLTYCISALIFSFALSSARADDLSEIVNGFSSYDADNDGINELESMTILPSSNTLPPIDHNSKLLFVIIESRLIANDQRLHGENASLVQTMRRYQQMLYEDGWHAVLVEAKIHASERHQDGMSVIALRRMFQKIKSSFPQFGGAVLVGSFPEAMLVRRWIWKRSDRAVSFGDLTFNSKGQPTADFLAIKPEVISKRSEVVLCDLEGKWEEIYHEEPTTVESITVMPETFPETRDWPQWSQPFDTSRFSVTKRTYSDYFFIDDSKYEYEQLPDGKVRFRGSSQMLVPETGGDDSKLPNPIATPDIMVSRINPLHVAVNQPMENLDESGKPKARGRANGSPSSQFHRDPTFELQLLHEYFERNFSHRHGDTAADAKRVALLTTDLQTPSRSYFSATSKQMGSSIANFPKSTAVGFAEFIASPAVIKGVSAHSNPSCSMLLPGYDQSRLDEITGGAYWHWKASGAHYVPTYNDRSVRDKIHFSLLRTMWANGKLTRTGPAFYVHGGCEAMSPAGADKHPYNEPGYSDHTQIAECLMFYGNGLALIGRSKVYFDIPTGFGDVFTPTKGNFGEVLQEYYRVESGNAKLARSAASRNRAYFWSILGDWTLRLQY